MTLLVPQGRCTSHECHRVKPFTVYHLTIQGLFACFKQHISACFSCPFGARPQAELLVKLIASRKAKETKEVSELLEEALEVKKAKKQSQQKRQLALSYLFASFCAWEEGLQKSTRRVV